MHEIQGEIWGAVGGILQADNEGFFNLYGNHILWQIPDEVKGKWAMAVLNDDGSWNNFTMELGDPSQRKAFMEGKPPEIK